MKKIEFNRSKAVSYARTWALSRNKKYYDFSLIGGDCTNFVSQCIYAGAPIMNYKISTGWFYSSPSLRAPAWTGVDEFYNFATKNKGAGFYAIECEKSQIDIGDVVQLGNYDGDFYHTLIVSKIYNGKIYVCSHSIDALDKPLENYLIKKIRFLHVLGARSE